ncbi:MAG: hypothetical protein L3J39_18810 [Verrucomicrobiales bacterium]|nr:hypothetical protein [Verrucomicrobiales bacterium]
MSDELNTSAMTSDSHSEFCTHNSSFAKGARFTKAQLESAIIELLGTQGFPHVRGEHIARASVSEVLIKADLRAFLAKPYAADTITPQEAEKATHA